MDNIKKFEGFLDRMQGLLDNAKKQGHIIVRVEDLENAFPELKESKDERIRQFLIHEVTETSDEIMSYRNMNKKDVLAWLEKQSEQKPIFDVEIPFGAKDSELQEATYYIPKGFHAEIDDDKIVIKKGEKPVWSEEDKEMFKSLKTLLNNASCYSCTEGVDKILSWLKSLEERVQLQPKHEWSEEDEEMYKEVLTDIIYAKNNLKAKECHGLSKRAMEAFNWFSKKYKSIRPQNKYAYNPYKEVVESIAEMCKHYDKASHSGLRDFYDNVKVKCKDAKEYDSLFPQNTWKPSDEMLEALYRVIPENVMEKSEDEMLLDKLYQGLKYGRVLSEN